ncbi:MAG: phosphotransferase family protein [Acidimicrobiales bacterium]
MSPPQRAADPGATFPPGSAPESAPGPAPESAPVGIDDQGVAAWFLQHVPGARPPLAYTLVAGGRSNLTYRVTDASGRVYALRRPPTSHVLPTAHDMAREYRVMTALGPTAVPVPATYGLCEDPAVTGAPFYVMEFVEGHILRDQAAAEGAFDPGARARIGDEMADTLAALHAVDPDRVGLGDLGRRHGYVERQLRRWTEQFRQMVGPDDDHAPLVEQVGAALAATIPVPAGGGPTTTAVVHGDYRLDNVVLNDAGQVAAVLDWEICTLGDPMADVGLLMVYWAEPGDGEPFLGQTPPTVAAGFASRATVLTRYASASGRDVSDVGYYMAFGYWKLACILQGVYTRYVAGAGAGDAGSVEAFPRTVARLAQMAATTLEER